MKKIRLVNLDVEGVDFSNSIYGGIADDTVHQEQPSGAEKIVKVMAANGFECSHDEARKMWVSYSRKGVKRDWDNISFNTIAVYSDQQIFAKVKEFFEPVG